MIISRISVRNWKNFKEAEAQLRDRTFLIGPNASGKSNFLDIFRFLREISTGGLASAVGNRGGVSALRSLAARRYSDIDCEITLAKDSGEKLWTYRLVFNQDKASRPVIRAETVHRAGRSKPILQRPEPEDHRDVLRLTQTALEQVNANKDFRDIADFLSSISYQHIVPQAVRDPKGFTGVPVKNDPFGRDFLLRLWNTPARTRDARLRKITAALKVAVPTLQELVVEMDLQGITHLKGRYQHWRPQGAFQSEAQFSDGTLRLLGILWVLFEGSGPILLEEPELSLHAEVVRHLPSMFERIHRVRKTRRQMLVSTHSAEMLSDAGIAAEEVIWIEFSEAGSVLKQANKRDREMMKSGMTAADVLIPKSAPEDVEQLLLSI